MANTTALSTNNPTLLDLKLRMAPDGSIDNIVEYLTQTNEILDDMTFVEGNLTTGHRTTVRTGLPAPTWRRLYGGVQPAKSTTVQITDNTGSLEAYAEVDKALADLHGNAAAFRLSEDRAFIDGINNEFARTLWYGNEGTNPEQFTGFTPRYNDGTNASNKLNVVKAGTSQTNYLTSIWLIGWGENTVHGIIPKGSKAGLQHQDLGEVTVENVDGGGGRAQMYRSHYRWDVGLTVRDWRYAVRIANIDTNTLVKGAATGADLTDLMATAIEILPSLGLCRPVFYCSRNIKSWLRRQMTNKTVGSSLTVENMAGKHVMSFAGIPVKRSDSLKPGDGTTYETLVS